MGRLWRYGEPDSAPLSGRKICLATPSYGDVSPGFVMSILGACDQLRVHNIDCVFLMYSEHCHVDDSRNHLVKHFLETDCTDLVWIDADMQINPIDIITIIEHDCDVVGGIVRLKQDNEEYAVKLLDENTFPDVNNGPIEVYSVGTAFLRIRRHVIEKLAEQAIKFPDKHMGGMVPIIFERSVEDGCRWGGDYTFCRKWRKLGGKIFADPSIELWHTGFQHWRGMYSAWVKRNSNLGLSVELNAIKNAVETPRTIHELCLVYGNENQTATPEIIQTLIIMARQCDGNILEAGSGLSTLVMAAANPKATIWAFEDNPLWQKTMMDLMLKYDLKNVRLLMSELKDYGDFTWYTLPDDLPSFDLVFVDGPRGNMGHRGAIYPLLSDKVKSGATVIYDDYSTRVDSRHVELWGGKINEFGAKRSFVITTKKD